jgi:hypothetical protein
VVGRAHADGAVVGSGEEGRQGAGGNDPTSGTARGTSMTTTLRRTARRQWSITKSVMAGQPPPLPPPHANLDVGHSKQGRRTSPVHSLTTEVAPVLNYAAQRPSTSTASMAPPHLSSPPPRPLSPPSKILHGPALLPPHRRRSPPPSIARRHSPSFSHGIPPSSRCLPLNRVNFSLSSVSSHHVRIRPGAVEIDCSNLNAELEGEYHTDTDF